MITAVSGAATANTTVKFIAQPTAMDVFIALNPAVSGLASLQFSLVNGSGATFSSGSESAVNGATGSLIVANQASGSDTTVIALISAAGFNTGTTPIIKLSYGITSGLPGMQVSSSGISATRLANPADPLSGVPLALTPQNFVVTIKYNTDTF
ncbi:hypothetical protein [Geotalea daltonii]|uniref:hypothetical protein n=1 Tax=Geotalea daltonii TaxID=1203471 RepID=UPI000674B257|nr:hypothetical protein [Geotalea daltonii]